MRWDIRCTREFIAWGWYFRYVGWWCIFFPNLMSRCCTRKHFFLLCTTNNAFRFGRNETVLGLHKIYEYLQGPIDNLCKYFKWNFDKRRIHKDSFNRDIQSVWKLFDKQTKSTALMHISHATLKIASLDVQNLKNTYIDEKLSQNRIRIFLRKYFTYSFVLYRHVRLNQL